MKRKRDRINICLILIATIIYSLSLLLLPSNASEIKCQGLPTFITGTDHTALMLESYRVPYGSERWHEINDLLNVEYAYSPLNGFYDWNGTWVIVQYTAQDTYRLWAGTDWTIGSDGQLHNPTCYMDVSPDYEWYMAQFDKLWYPKRNQNYTAE